MLSVQASAGNGAAGRSDDLIGDDENPFVDSLSVDRGRMAQSDQAGRRSGREDDMDPSMAELMGHAPRPQPSDVNPTPSYKTAQNTDRPCRCSPLVLRMCRTTPVESSTVLLLAILFSQVMTSLEP